MHTAWLTVDMPLDAALLQMSVEALDVGLLELDLRDRRGDVAEREHAQLLAARDQALHLLELLELRGQRPLVSLSCLASQCSVSE